MSAAETIRMAEASGIRLGVEGADLILNADLEPPVDVVNAIRQYKAEIIELLATPRDRWTAEDWQAFFDERASIAEFDGGLPHPEAEARAFECCLVEWLNRHPLHSDPGRCAWCEKPDRDGHTVVPFGTESHGHIWLHPECWDAWNRNRRAKAERALWEVGLKKLSTNHHPATAAALTKCVTGSAPGSRNKGPRRATEAATIHRTGGFTE